MDSGERYLLPPLKFSALPCPDAGPDTGTRRRRYSSETISDFESLTSSRPREPPKAASIDKYPSDFQVSLPNTAIKTSPILQQAEGFDTNRHAYSHNFAQNVPYNQQPQADFYMAANMSYARNTAYSAPWPTYDPQNTFLTFEQQGRVPYQPPLQLPQSQYAYPPSPVGAASYQQQQLVFGSSHLGPVPGTPPLTQPILTPVQPQQLTTSPPLSQPLSASGKRSRDTYWGTVMGQTPSPPNPPVARASSFTCQSETSSSDVRNGDRGSDAQAYELSNNRMRGEANTVGNPQSDVNLAMSLADLSNSGRLAHFGSDRLASQGSGGSGVSKEISSQAQAAHPASSLKPQAGGPAVSEAVKAMRMLRAKSSKATPSGHRVNHPVAGGTTSAVGQTSAGSSFNGPKTTSMPKAGAPSRLPVPVDASATHSSSSAGYEAQFASKVMISDTQNKDSSNHGNKGKKPVHSEPVSKAHIQEQQQRQQQPQLHNRDAMIHGDNMDQGEETDEHDEDLDSDEHDHEHEDEAKRGSERPFECNQCNLSFSHRSALKCHTRVVHNKERPFMCAQCPATFGHKGDLNRHVMIVHENKRPFECATCGTSFGRKSVLKRHMQKVHRASATGGVSLLLAASIMNGGGASPASAPGSVPGSVPGATEARNHANPDFNTCTTANTNTNAGSSPVVVTVLTPLSLANTPATVPVMATDARGALLQTNSIPISPSAPATNLSSVMST